MNWNDTKQHILELVRYEYEQKIIDSKPRTDTTREWVVVGGQYLDLPMLEFIDGGFIDPEELWEYSHEFADSAEWVIYTAKARALWADSWEISDHEDEYGYNGDETVDQKITTCVYLATREAVMDSIRTIQKEVWGCATA